MYVIYVRHTTRCRMDHCFPPASRRVPRYPWRSTCTDGPFRFVPRWILKLAAHSSHTILRVQRSRALLVSPLAPSWPRRQPPASPSQSSRAHTARPSRFRTELFSLLSSGAAAANARCLRGTWGTLPCGLHLHHHRHRRTPTRRTDHRP